MGKKILIIGVNTSIGKTINEIITIEKEYLITKIPDISMPFIPNKKVRSKYKRNLKYK